MARVGRVAFDNYREDREEHRRGKISVLRMRREIREVVDPFNIPNSQFVEHYRLSKARVRTLLEEIEPFMPDDLHPRAIPNSIKLLAAINFYASGSYQRTTGSSWLHCMGRSTVGECIETVTNALNQPVIQRRWIRFPHTRQERELLMARHQEQFKIPGVVGFIDGTEISICCPPNDINAQTFWTHKHHYAINTQIICDSSLKIMNIIANFPGSCNDAFIFRGSASRRIMIEAHQQSECWLLGDSGYACEPWLLTPILNAEPGHNLAFYTECHCSARNCVERCIGLLKMVFRCLLRERILAYTPPKSGRIIKACAVLHNMRIQDRMAPPPHDINDLQAEEEGIPWVPDQYEAEEGEEPEFDVLNERRGHLREIALVHINRIADFLAIRRQELDVRNE